MNLNTWGNFYLPWNLKQWVPFVFILVLGSYANAQTYCASGGSSTFDTEVDAVIFNTINNNTAGTCATYSDFTSMSTVVTIGQTVNLSVTAGTCGGSFTKSGKVFIDWNDDGDFLDTGEEVFVFGPNSATYTSSTTVTVPGTATISTTRMRVVVQETGTPALVSSCGTFTWGETEDYTVIINPSSPNDVGISSIVEPTSGCNLSATDTVKVTVANFGTNSQSGFNVNYQVNAGPVVTENIGATTITTGGSYLHTFNTTTNLSTPGTYTIKAWTSLASDTVPINDTAVTTVTSIPGVSVYPYTEDFEGGTGGWIASGTGTWAYGTPAKPVIVGAASGTKAWVTGGLGSGDYNNNEDSWVIGPCFDFSSLSNPWISMSVWWNAEFSWDGAVLQASTDFGTTWITIGNFGDPNNWYTDNTITGAPGGSQEGWSGRTSTSNGSNGWVTAAHALDGLAGQSSVRLRVAFGSDGSVTDDGFAFDDVFIGDGPVPNLGPDQLICTQDTLLLNPGNFSSYIWSTGDTSQTDTITIATSGFVSVIVRDSLGFVGRDTILISPSNPIVNLGPDSTICPGDTIVLDAGNPGGTYLWSTSETTQTISVVSGGTVSVQIQDSVGCPASDSMVVTLAVPPALNLGNDTTVCANASVTLDGGPGPLGTTYLWSTGASTQLLVVSAPGTYVANVTTPGGCTAIDTILVANYPNPGTSLGPDRIECGPFTLDAGAGAAGYSWSTGATSQSISPSSGGNYSVTISNTFGCTFSDTVTINMVTPPTVNLGPDQVICNGVSATLDAGNPGSTYFWSNGSTTQSITVSTPGVYIVEVTGTNGCVVLDTINIAGSNLSVNLGPDITLCGGQTVSLNAGNPGSTYSWSTGASTQSVSVSSAGTYTVTVTDAAGCSGTDDINVNSVPGVVAVISSPATATIFYPTQFTDASTGSPASWFWDFGDGNTSTAQSPQHTYAAFGTFTVTLIVTDGTCADTTTSTINVNNYIGIDESIFASTPEVFPNPSDGVFNLRLELLDMMEVGYEIADMAGRVVKRADFGRVSQVSTKIDLTTLPMGVYTLKLELDGQPFFMRLARQ